MQVTDHISYPRENIGTFGCLLSCNYIMMLLQLHRLHSIESNVNMMTHVE
jgi:hypothetical protein